MIKEESTKLDIKQDKISKKAEIFYNPVMKFNRDVSLLLLNSISNKDMQIALPLCASGVRGLRMLKELKKSKIKNISFNDNDEKAILSLKNNIELNGLNNKKTNEDKIKISNTEANLFLMGSQGFDYIDLDPFGSPIYFLDQSIKKLSRKSILAVTTTDTSALAGTYVNATKRKYWSSPLRNELMHEVGVRILIRRVQLIGAQYDRALIPIYSYSKDHYYRVFFKCSKGKTRADDILKEHKYLIYDKDKLKVEIKHLDQLRGGMIAGPLWVGQLWDKSIAEKISQNKLNLDLSKEEQNLLNTIKEESKLKGEKSVGFLDLHQFGKVYKKNLSFEKVFKILDNNKIKAAKTHFNRNGVKGISGDELYKFITR